MLCDSEYKRVPKELHATKSTTRTFTSLEIKLLLEPAVEALDRKFNQNPSRQLSVPEMARMVDRHHELFDMDNLDVDEHPPPLRLALRIATAQSARDVFHKPLLLPALLHLKVVESEHDEAWKPMSPEKAAQLIPPRSVRDLSAEIDGGETCGNVFQAQVVAKRFRKNPNEALAVVQAIYYSEARCAVHLSVLFALHLQLLCAWQVSCVLLHREVR